jgi:hypothetical protein
VAADVSLNPDAIARALHAAFCRGVSRRELLQTAVDKLGHAGLPYTGVHAYLATAENRLSLVASAGTPTDRTEVTMPTGDPEPALFLTPLDDPGVVRVEAVIRRHAEILGAIAAYRTSLGDVAASERADLEAVADALAALL